MLDDRLDSAFLRFVLQENNMCNSLGNLSSFWRELLCHASNETVMSAITQIQIAQVAAIITLLSISMAVSKDKIFGLQIKDLLSIGGDLKFRFFTIYMILQLALLIICVYGLLYMKSAIILLSFIASITTSIVISCIFLIDFYVNLNVSNCYLHYNINLST